MASGIYQILNVTTGMYYVGSSLNILHRWAQHRHDLRAGKHGNSHLQASWNKYGEQMFVFSTIEECQSDILTTREAYWMSERNSVDNGYNLSYDVTCPRRGTKMLPEQIEAMKTNPKMLSYWHGLQKPLLAIPAKEDGTGFALIFDSVKQAGDFFGGGRAKVKVSNILTGCRGPHQWGYSFKYL